MQGGRGSDDERWEACEGGLPVSRGNRALLIARMKNTGWFDWGVLSPRPSALFCAPFHLALGEADENSVVLMLRLALCHARDHTENADVIVWV